MIVIASHILGLSFSGDSTYNFGAMGVLIFFALSGFLMSTLYSDEKFTLDSVGKYSIARMARIAPAYWIAIAFAWVLYMAIPDFHYQMTPFMMLRSIFFGGNQGVFWSIPPEIQFYGFFILLWFAAFKVKQGQYLWLILSAVICTACIATKDMWGGLMLPSKMHIFIGGFLVAFLVKHEKTKNILCHPAMQAGLVLSSILYFLFLLEEKAIYEDFVIPCLIALSIGSLSQTSKLTYLLETKTMGMMGAASFSIYLFHEPILYAMKDIGLYQMFPQMPMIAFLCLVSIAIPVAFHYLVEKGLTKGARKMGMDAFENIKPRLEKLPFIRAA